MRHILGEWGGLRASAALFTNVRRRDQRNIVPISVFFLKERSADGLSPFSQRPAPPALTLPDALLATANDYRLSICR
jgi:hypothetical protein